MITNSKEKELINKMNKSNIKILGIEESINKIKNKNLSLSRFGDGELNIIYGKNIRFQKSSPKLAEMLKHILKEEQDFCCLGIPDAINRFENLTKESKTFWINNMLKDRDKWIELLNPHTEYLTANLTRLYIRHNDKTNCEKYFDLLKSIWENKDVIICEGEQTRMGVGNDLLSNCNSIQRILCPSENAFDKYEEILTELKQKNKNSLFLIALGPTATVLAYELAKEGFHALDLGHLDIEYEWFLRQSSKKEKIENKYVNEVTDGNFTANMYDDSYLKQIYKIIK